MIIGDKKVCDEVISLHDKLALEMQTGQWNSITLCSAFLTKGAAESVIELIKGVKIREKLKVTIIIGVKNHFTVPDAIKILLNYIESSNRSNFEFNLRLPRDTDFHMKCYVFLGKKGGKAIVGSANLTDSGLESRGELMVEVDDEHIIDIIVNHIDHYLNESEDWHDYVNKYANIYEKTKFEIIKINKSGLFKKTRIHKIKQKMTIRFTAPTMGALGKVSEGQEERVREIFDGIKKQFPDINKSNYIIYSELTADDIDTIIEKYPIGSCFDRPEDIDSTWEIGTKRMICNVGAIINTMDDEIVMFMKKGCTHYTVTEEIIEVAEKFEIKLDDENYIPTKKEIDEYKQVILDKRSK